MEAILEAQVSVRSLRDLSRHDTRSAGGKGANLGELMRAGVTVPDGFVVTTDAFAAFVQQAGLGTDATTADVERAPVPALVADAIRRALSAHFPGPDVALAVRSSAVGEDAAGASFAGQYESFLEVRGAEAVLAAVRRCWASAYAPRLVDYRRRRGEADPPRIAVVVQRMVPADAAGVAFTADPVSGERAVTLVSAVAGLGERLVSGEASPDDWTIRDGRATRRTTSGPPVLDAARAERIAALARRIEAHFGSPQDVEWAIAGETLFVVQARPITALPDEVSWRVPPGGWLRNFRIGEWLPEPVTPLFETWLVRALEDGFDDFYEEQSGIRGVPPGHTIVNGWYFASLNFVPSMPVMIWRLLTRMLPRLLFGKGRRALAILPPAQGACIELFLPEWRALLERYRAAVPAAAARQPALSPPELLAQVDELARLAGRLFGIGTLVGGRAWKIEVPLAAFCNEHLADVLESHQELLQGLFIPAPAAHDVQSFDWVRPTAGETGADAGTDAQAEGRRRQLEARRLDAEERARAALSPKRRAKFDALLAEAQRFVPIRDEHASTLTLAWPVMRAALLRLGRHLADRSLVAQPEDVFFLTRDELGAAVEGATARVDVAARRARWEAQRRLTPPLLLGTPSKMVRSVFEQAEGPLRREVGADAVVSGMPASPGRRAGRVRVIRGVEDFVWFEDGEVLVAPATMPAWTPLFPRAAAVVTDVGSVIAHAALVAREYGIPAVVGTGNATATLKTGDLVTVDGTRGVVLRGTKSTS